MSYSHVHIQHMCILNIYKVCVWTVYLHMCTYVFVSLMYTVCICTFMFMCMNIMYIYKGV